MYVIYTYNIQIYYVHTTYIHILYIHTHTRKLFRFCIYNVCIPLKSYSFFNRASQNPDVFKISKNEYAVMMTDRRKVQEADDQSLLTLGSLCEDRKPNPWLSSSGCNHILHLGL